MILFILCTVIVGTVSAYHIRYKEQYYRLYRQHFYSYPEDIAESIFYLEQALKADFANPLYAMAVIRTPEEWNHYRNLFMMQCNLLLVELYTRMAGRYDRQAANFWLAPWKQENLNSLDIAEDWYNEALGFWKQATAFAAQIKPFGFNLTQVQHWEDDAYRINTKDLDWADIIADHLKRLKKVRAALEAMDENTY